MLTSKNTDLPNSSPFELQVGDHADAEAETCIDQRLTPGMLVLAPPFRLIHMNQAAWELLQLLAEDEHRQNNGQASKRAKGLLPRPLHDLSDEILRHLRERPYAKDWERFELKRLIGTRTHPILVRAFGIPDQTGPDESRVVLLLEEVGRRREPASNGAIERFSLTEREKTVVQCLGKGWTNKEIAAALKLALPTVKEHIRHIMDKTNTSTRTGILVELFHR